MFVDLTWASIIRCFTPTLLFLLLNLMIAIIALISKPNAQNQHQNKPKQPTIDLQAKCTKPDSESTIPNFQQVSESFLVPQYLFDESPQRTETLFFPEPKDSVPEDSQNEQDQLSMDEIYSRLTTGGNFSRPSCDSPAKTSARMGKSAEEGDAEVDAKADDFINRFREQLKLQRVESVIKQNSGEVNGI